MYELSHILLLFWGGQVGIVGRQGMEDRPAVAAQFLAIRRTIFPKLAVPLRKEADKGQFGFPQPETYKAPLFPPPAAGPLTGDTSPEADPAHMWLRAERPGLPWGQGLGTAKPGRQSLSGLGPVGTLVLGLGKSARGA